MSWYYAKKAPPLAIALVIHGLNVRPDKMLPLIGVLNSLGLHAFNLNLQGHGDNFAPISENAQYARIQSLKQVTHDLWIEETLQAYQEVKRCAQAEGRPRVLLGFSLGAVLGLELFLHTEKPFERMILLAPPLVIHRRGYLLKLLKRFPHLVLKSLTPREYRANEGTPIAAYLALFRAIAHVHQLPPTINIPTQILLDPQDEMVASHKIPSFLSVRKLTHWNIAYLQKQPVTSASPQQFHHLMLDEPSLGKTAWEQLQQLLQAHLAPLEK